MARVATSVTRRSTLRALKCSVSRLRQEVAVTSIRRVILVVVMSALGGCATQASFGTTARGPAFVRMAATTQSISVADEACSHMEVRKKNLDSGLIEIDGRLVDAQYVSRQACTSR